MSYKNAGIKGTTPSGDNNSPALKSHIDSYLYDLFFPISTGTGSIPSGQIRETMKVLYGKVDTKGYVVLPREDFMFEYAAKDGSISHTLLGPVRKCFIMFVEYYEKLEARQKLSDKSVYYKDAQPFKTFVDQANVFQSYISDINTDIVDSIITTEEATDIDSYSAYEKHYLKKMSRKISFGENLTLAEFCLSKYSTPLQTGLVIDMSDDDCSDDRVKAEGYLTDDNFMIFQKAANRFGFRVDRHIPWRIYFDLASPFVKELLEDDYSISSLEEFFEEFYYRVHEEDVMKLSEQIYESYQELCEKSPSYMKPEKCTLTLGTSIEVKERETLSRNKFHKLHSERHKIRLYAYFRALERRIPMTQRRFDKLVEEAHALYLYRSEPHACNYIESAFIDRTSDIISEKGLTNEEHSGRMITTSRYSIKF